MLINYLRLGCIVVCRDDSLVSHRIYLKLEYFNGAPVVRRYGFFLKRYGNLCFLQNVNNYHFKILRVIYEGECIVNKESTIQTPKNETTISLRDSFKPIRIIPNNIMEYLMANTKLPTLESIYQNYQNQNSHE